MEEILEGALEEKGRRLPKWVREIKRFLGIKSQFVLSGNIYDIYPVPYKDLESISVGPLENLLAAILEEGGYKGFYKFEPFFLTTIFDRADNENALTVPKGAVTLGALTSFVKDLVVSKEPRSLLISYSSRLSSIASGEDIFLFELFRLSMMVQASQGRFNLIFWALDKENDLPAWYSNPRVMYLPIPKPDNEIRRYIIQSAGPVIKGYKDLEAREPKKHRTLLNRFVDQTGGLYASELVSIARLAAMDRLDFGRIDEAVRHYKLGVPDNPWAKLNREVILGGYDILSKRVIGQERAVNHSLDIIKRSIFDLSGAQFSPHSQKPKGVLFFAGPTGVGKTELAKGITELVFGSPENYIRFDMSEFNQSHADQRLIGAPPGYVGYDVGGELTNAIKQNPFTLILFDEIEKAHPRILDIFLQVLDDGRLTSGRGETVYFTDAMIVFTSNFGIYNEVKGAKDPITLDLDYEELNKRITTAIDDFFRFTLNRPEILNRIGKNIVVFDFIRPKSAFLIFQKMLENILVRLQDIHSISLVLGPGDLEILGGLVTQDLSMGGRGIGNAVEELFINPLARELYFLGAKPGDKIECRLTLEGDKSKLNLERL